MIHCDFVMEAMADTDDSLATNVMRRAACDNCHDSKSRCSKDADSDKCQRCTRLGSACTHRPPLRMGRPRENGGKQLSGQNSMHLTGENQCSTFRGRKNSGRAKRISQPQRIPLEANVAHGEKGPNISVLRNEGPATVTQEAHTEHVPGKECVMASSPDSCDRASRRPQSHRSTASLSTSHDTSDITEGIWENLEPACYVLTYQSDRCCSCQEPYHCAHHAASGRISA